jgi:hypothetical protein
MNAETNHPLSISSSQQASALALELAKIVKLVAPVSMDPDAQLAWLASAIEALEGIRPEEVQAVSLQVRRKATRLPQIVPMLTDLIAERRAKSARTAEPNPFSEEMRINAEAQRRRAKASALDKVALSWIYEWERSERKKCGLHVPEYPKPLTRAEIDAMPSHMRQLGIQHGFLKMQGGKLVEVETDEEATRLCEELNKR